MATKTASKETKAPTHYLMPVDKQDEEHKLVAIGTPFTTRSVIFIGGR